MSELLEIAIETFDDEANAREWLNRPHPLLNGLNPWEAAKTPEGLRHVERILSVIRYGGVV